MFYYLQTSFLTLSILLLLLLSFNIATGRKCEEKCKEYSKYVYVEEVGVAMLPVKSKANVVAHCGVLETVLIIGGTKAHEMEFPHMAVIGFGRNETTNITWQCGGTVISETFVLTAAHCLNSRKGPAIKVRTGLIDLKNPGDTLQERTVVERISHPNYRYPRKYHDIALLKLQAPFDLNQYVRPACLQVQTSIAEKSAIASGFGKTNTSSKTGSSELMKVQLNYVSEDDCEKSFAGDSGTRKMPDGLIPQMMCAGVKEGGKDTCQGDSGGPLQRVLTEPYCMYSIVGVTSFGKLCAMKNSPAIYTRVSAYLDWIEGKVWP